MLAKDFIPSLQLQVKPVLCRETKGLVTELWSRKFVTQWLCSQLCYETAANEWTLVKIEILVTVGWKWGCQPFSCRSSLNVTYCRKDICSTCLSKESIPAIPFGISKHPLPTRSRSLRATVGSTSSAFCLHHAHPFVAAAEKASLMQRSIGFGHGVVASKICYNTVIVQWDCCKPTNTCQDWDFSNSGLEVWLPAFQLPMFSKCDAPLKRDLLDMFV